jgi:DNA-binding GntR family transcriptional regulator
MTIGYGDVPRYQQLAAILRDQIASGELQAHAPIPSKRMLRQQYGLAGNTIDKAVDVLRSEGLVKTVMGLGIFVVAPEDRPQP